MPLRTRTAVVVCAVLGLLLLGSAGAMVWMHWDRAWLKPVRNRVIVAGRIDEATPRSREYQGMVYQLLLATRYYSQFHVDEVSYGSRSWPRTYAWVQISGWRDGLSQPAEELKTLRLAMAKDPANAEFTSRCRIAIVEENGAVTESSAAPISQ